MGDHGPMFQSVHAPRVRALVDHPVRAYRHFSARNGPTIAAAVTYFGFLSLFPLLALSFATVGFVAHNRPEVQHVLDAVLQSLLPGMIGNEPDQIPLAAIRDAAGAAAGIGVLTMMYAGLNWISEMRDAVAAMFDVESSRGPSFGRAKMIAAVSARARDAVALMAIGLILLVSVGVSGGLLSFLRHLGRTVGVDDDLGFVMPILLVAAGVLTGTVLFFAMFRFLAAAAVANRALWSGALGGCSRFRGAQAGIDVAARYNGAAAGLPGVRHRTDPSGVDLLLLPGPPVRRVVGGNAQKRRRFGAPGTNSRSPRRT